MRTNWQRNGIGIFGIFLVGIGAVLMPPVAIGESVEVEGDVAETQATEEIYLPIVGEAHAARAVAASANGIATEVESILALSSAPSLIRAFTSEAS